MTKNYKLLLLDLDGTTVASDGNALPSHRVIKAIQSAQQSLHVALATGRPKHLAQPVYEAIGLNGPSVFNGGAEIVDVSSNKQLFKQMIPLVALREIVRVALPFGYAVYTDDDQYGSQISHPNDLQSEAAKVFIEAVDEHRAIELLEVLTSVKGVAAHPTTSWNEGSVVDIHVTHEHATKRHGVERLMEIIGCKTEETIAIGDSYNDLPLLEAAGLKIAMGNAPPEVKAVADYITGSLFEDGVAQAIEKYILR